METLALLYVREFSGQIACEESLLSQTGIPKVGGKAWGVPDIESPVTERFDHEDVAAWGILSLYS